MRSICPNLDADLFKKGSPNAKAEIAHGFDRQLPVLLCCCLCRQVTVGVWFEKSPVWKERVDENIADCNPSLRSESPVRCKNVSGIPHVAHGDLMSWFDRVKETNEAIFL